MTLSLLELLIAAKNSRLFQEVGNTFEQFELNMKFATLFDSIGNIFATSGLGNVMILSLSSEHSGFLKCYNDCGKATTETMFASNI